MNEVRTFRARTLHDALNVVRRELGAEAVILQTSQAPTSRLWPWARRDVMVTARNENSKGSQSTAPVNNNRLPPDLTRSGERPVTATRSGSSVSGNAPFGQRQLDSLRQLVEQLQQNHAAQAPEAPDEFPDALRTLYQHLIQQSIPDATVREWIDRLQQTAPEMFWDDYVEAQRKLVELLERQLACTDGIRVSPSCRKVLALVGPTGVGKTTTLGKLAANFKLRTGLRIGLVTLDTYRIAAADQLRCYAEAIQVPFRAVSNATDLQQALADFADFDLVLIDTAGQRPSDHSQLQQMQELLATAGVDEIHLVLSVTASHGYLSRTIRQFSALPVTSLILTKLDEAPNVGQLLAAVPELDCPISYLTSGQEIPNDIEPAQSPRLARLMLGMEP